jgi:hypothetical protein
MEHTMTRGRTSHAERDLHAVFTLWLQSGAGGDPPRDAAVHAAHCVRCRGATMALDHLSVIDVGRASMPPSRGIVSERTGRLARPRLVAAAASGFVVVAAAAWIGIGAFAPGLLGPGAEGPSTDQDVLGGFGAGGPATTDTSPALSFGAVTSESNDATPDPNSATVKPTPAGTATPVFVATPAPTAIQPLPTNPPPSVGQTVAPTAFPSRTASPTPLSSGAPPTPEPTPPSDDPTPSPSEGGTP